MTRPLLLAAAWAAAVLPLAARAADKLTAADYAKRANDALRPVAERLAAIEKLKEFKGDAAVPGYPGLITALNDKNEKIKTAADDVLAEVAPEFRKSIRSLLFDRDGRANYAAAVDLAKMGPSGKAAVPALLSHLRTGVANSAKVGGLGEEWLEADIKAEVCVPVVGKCMAAGGLTATTLENLPPAERRAWQTINRNGQVLATVLADAVAIVRVAPDDAKTVKAVADATLGSPNNVVQFSGLIAMALAEPAAAKPNLPAVRRLKTASDKPVRDLAGVVIKRLEEAK